MATTFSPQRRQGAVGAGGVSKVLLTLLQHSQQEDKQGHVGSWKEQCV